MRDPLLVEALQKLRQAISLISLAIDNRERDLPDPNVAFLDQPLNLLDFGPGYTVRLQNMFRNRQQYHGPDDIVDAPLRTVRDLIALSEAELMREPNIGKESVNRLKAMLAPHGLHLGMGLFSDTRDLNGQHQRR